MRRRTISFWRNNITSERGLQYAKDSTRGCVGKDREKWGSHGGGGTSIGESFSCVVGRMDEGRDNCRGIRDRIRDVVMNSLIIFFRFFFIFILFKIIITDYIIWDNNYNVNSYKWLISNNHVHKNFFARLANLFLL